MTTPLLMDVIAAHGGVERWTAVRRLSPRIRMRARILLLRLQSPRMRSFDVSVDTECKGLRRIVWYIRLKVAE